MFHQRKIKKKHIIRKIYQIKVILKLKNLKIDPLFNFNFNSNHSVEKFTDRGLILICLFFRTFFVLKYY